MLATPTRRQQQGRLPIAALLLLAAWGCTSRGDSGITLGPVERLNAEAGTLARFTFPYYTALQALPGGGAVAVWMRQEGGFQPLVHRRAADATAAFGDERHLGTEAFRDTISVAPRLAEGATASELYAVWQVRRPVSGDKFVVFRRSPDAGATWVEERTINAETHSFLPAIAADRAGGVYVVWTDERRRGLEVFFNRSLDRGATWSPEEVRLDDSERGAAVSVAIASDGAERLVAVWEDRGRGRRRVRAAASADRGATWSEPVAVSDPTARYSPGAPRVIFAGGRFIVVWTAAATNVAAQVWSDASLDGGLTWGEDVLLHEVEKGVPSAVDVASDGTRARAVFHAGPAGGPWHILYVATGEDGVWELPESGPAQVSRGEGRFSNARLAADAGGRLAAVYEDNLKRVLLAHSRDGGATWDPESALLDEIAEGQGKASVRYPQVAMADGVAYVMWEVWADTSGLAKSFPGMEGGPAPADLFVRRVTFRR
jgi:hypothetical protein